jgi:hypothetical protein
MLDLTPALYHRDITPADSVRKPHETMDSRRTFCYLRHLPSDRRGWRDVDRLVQNERHVASAEIANAIAEFRSRSE